MGCASHTIFFFLKKIQWNNTYTRILRTVPFVPTKSSYMSYIFSKINPLYGYRLIRTTDTLYCVPGDKLSYIFTGPALRTLVECGFMRTVYFLYFHCHNYVLVVDIMSDPVQKMTDFYGSIHYDFTTKKQ